MSEHTPGPWETQDTTRGIDIVSRDCRVACVCITKNAETDAHLIAAAPDMLAALQRVNGINDNPAIYNRDIDDITRAAIAKATGGE